MTHTAAAAVEALWPDGRRRPVRLGATLAEGGDARVHAVRGRADLVAKVYHDPAAEPRRRAKLEAMLAAPPDGRGGAGGGDVRLAWPVALLEAGGAGPPAGFLMPRVDLDRVAAAANLAAAVTALHARGHHVVDLKPPNVHVYRGVLFVALLDCDGMSVAGPDGGRFPAHQYTDGHIAPEALRARARPEALGEARTGSRSPSSCFNS